MQRRSERTKDGQVVASLASGVGLTRKRKRRSGSLFIFSSKVMSRAETETAAGTALSRTEPLLTFLFFFAKSFL